MPVKAATNCTRLSCNGTVRDGVCSRCGVRRAPDARASAWRRGYGGAWRRLRAMVLADSPLCAECERDGRVTLATDVHHKTPLREGGENTFGNLEPLCHSCHSRVTARGG